MQLSEAHKLILIGGSVRSGKSRFALELASGLGERRSFIATAEASDDEMRQRVARHKEERDPGFRTIEEPLRVPDVLSDIRDQDVVVIDCLTLWLANLLLRGQSESAISAEIQKLVTAIDALPAHVVIVTNEVGMGVVPEYPLGRAFRDVVGLGHQLLSRRANEIYFAALGCILRLKPEPLQLMTSV